MSELKKKIYKYLVNHYFGLTGMHIKPINEAKDLAEIAYNYYMADNSPAKFENTKLQKENTDHKEMNKILADSRLKILGENQDLKKQIEDLEVIFNCVNDKNDELNRQLDKVEYLDGGKAKGIIIKEIKEFVENYWSEDNLSKIVNQNNIEYFVTALLLKIKVIKNTELKKGHEELIFMLAEKDKQIRLMKDVIKILEHDVRFWKDKSRGLTKPEQRIETIYNKGQCDTCMYSKIKYLDKKEVEKIIDKDEDDIMRLDGMVIELKKEIGDLETAFKCVNDKNDELDKQLVGMAKHIDELEHQIAGIKYLDRDEVEKIIIKIDSGDSIDYGLDENDRNKLIIALCSLAIPKQRYSDKNTLTAEIYAYFIANKLSPRDRLKVVNNLVDKIYYLAIPITKEKIVGKLNEYAKFYVNHTNEVIMDRREFGQIASEILGDKIDCYDKEGNIINKILGDDNENRK